MTKVTPVMIATVTILSIFSIAVPMFKIQLNKDLTIFPPVPIKILTVRATVSTTVLQNLIPIKKTETATPWATPVINVFSRSMLELIATVMAWGMRVKMISTTIRFETNEITVPPFRIAINSIVIKIKSAMPVITAQIFQIPIKKIFVPILPLFQDRNQLKIFWEACQNNVNSSLEAAAAHFLLPPRQIQNQSVAF